MIEKGVWYECIETFMQGRFTKNSYYYCLKEDHLLDNYLDLIGVKYVTQYFKPNKQLITKYIPGDILLSSNNTFFQIISASPGYYHIKMFDNIDSIDVVHKISIEDQSSSIHTFSIIMADSSSFIAPIYSRQSDLLKPLVNIDDVKVGSWFMIEKNNSFEPNKIIGICSVSNNQTVVFFENDTVVDIKELIPVLITPDILLKNFLCIKEGIDEKTQNKYWEFEIEPKNIVKIVAIIDNFDLSGLYSVEVLFMGKYCETLIKRVRYIHELQEAIHFYNNSTKVEIKI